MATLHGVFTKQVDTSISTPVTATSGIPFVVGTSPVHTVGGAVNQPILCYSYAEAVSAMGYGDDWEKYSICEMIYAQFQLYSVAPVVFVNVLDPSVHKSAVGATECPVVEKQVLLPLEALMDTVTVTGYTADDYDLFYSSEHLILEISASGGIPEDSQTLEISYDIVDPSKVSKSDIIGGLNLQTKEKTGFELVDSVYSKYAIVVDLLLAPGWSHDSEVAAIMSAKAESISGFFEGKAVIDVDTSVVSNYSQVAEWKKANNITQKYQILCYPKVTLGDRTYHLSVHFACRLSKLDTENDGCPYESPSNKTLQIDGIVTGDHVSEFLGNSEASYLNDNGVVTAINHIGGFVLWGNECACYPSDTDIKNYFICIGRMFAWVSNTIIQTFWAKVDKPMSSLLADTIVSSVNNWLSGLKTEQKIYGGRMEFRDDENSTTDLMSGKMVFHLYIAPFAPAKEIQIKIEYDPKYMTFALMS